MRDLQEPTEGVKGQPGIDAEPIEIKIRGGKGQEMPLGMLSYLVTLEEPPRFNEMQVSAKPQRGRARIPVYYITA